MKDLTNDSEYVGDVSSVLSATAFVVSLSSTIDKDHTFTIENQLLKGNSTDFTQLNNYVANVQNTYTNFGDAVIVASNSIPYYEVPTNPDDKKITFSGNFTSTQLITLTASGTDHGFYTGDAIWYKPSIVTTTTTTPDGIKITTETENKFEGVNEGIYYVKRVNPTQIRLSRSKADLFSGSYITFNGDINNNKIIYYPFYQKEVSPQKLYRSVLPPVNKSGEYTTVPGFNGMFVNGVELLNYKSTDTITYGDIRSFEVSRGGRNYDIITPPELYITDEVGTGATGTCCVSGRLERIDIIDNGFDYLDTPVISISGGNGKDADNSRS